MNRRDFVRLSTIGLTLLTSRNKMEARDKNEKMPIIFFGHGSPMNAIAKNSFTKYLSGLGDKIPRPKSILVISAHWVTDGTYVVANDRPKTIHDFGGFPKELYQLNYPSLGDLKLVTDLEKNNIAKKSYEWGLDHGAWTLLLHLYPKADIPVIQLSLNHRLTFQEHFDLAKKLNHLRTEGVLIIGSGNIVHNLREISWQENSPVMSWAKEFDELIKKHLEDSNDKAIVGIQESSGLLFKRAHPTYEHYLPLIYTVGAKDKNDKASFLFDEIQNGSISMRSVMFS